MKSKKQKKSLTIIQLISRIEKNVARAKRKGYDMNSASWGYEEGYLLPYNEMKDVVEYVRKLREALRAFISQTTPEFAESNGFSNARTIAKNVLNK